MSANSNRIWKKTLAITFILLILILPGVPVGAKNQKIQSTIIVEKVTKEIIRFIETIPITIDDPIFPEDATYIVSVYAVKTRGGVVLIDSGDDEYAEDLYEAVSSTVKGKIKAVYLTHYHSDHAGGGAYFQSKGIPVYAPQEEAFEISIGANLPQTHSDFTYEGYEVNGTYGNVKLNPGFRIIPAPGHTEGAVHIEVTKRKNSYLFTADTIMPMGIPNFGDPEFTFEINLLTAYQNYLAEMGSYGTFWTDQKNTLLNIQSEIAEYTLVLTGHTPVLSGFEATEYVISTLYWLEKVPVLF